MSRTYCASNLDDRASYRRDLQRAAQIGGGPALRRFVFRTQDLFHPVEVSRVRRAAHVWGWENLAYVIDHRFRYMRGLPHDPVAANSDSPRFPSIVETIITPHNFLRHAL